MKVENAKKRAGRTKRAKTTRFESNPFYERLLELKDKDPKVFKTLSAATKAALDAYLTHRRNALPTN